MFQKPNHSASLFNHLSTNNYFHSHRKLDGNNEEIQAFFDLDVRILASCVSHLKEICQSGHIGMREDEKQRFTCFSMAASIIVRSEETLSTKHANHYFSCIFILKPFSLFFEVNNRLLSFVICLLLDM